MDDPLSPQRMPTSRTRSAAGSITTSRTKCRSEFSGAIRFTGSGEEASDNSDLSVITYKQGPWGRVGTVAYTTPHDRSNDTLRA